MSGYGSGNPPGDEDPWRPPGGRSDQPQPGQPPPGQYQPDWYEPGQSQPGQPWRAGQPGGGPAQPPDPSSPQYPQYPQYPSAPPPYGYGYGGPGFGQPGQPVPMPPSVHWASIAMIVGAVLSMISTVVMFGRVDEIVDEAIRQASSGTVVDRDAVRAIVVGFAVFGLILSVLYILLALQVRRGRNWARIVAIIFAAISVFFGLFAMGRGYGVGVAGPDLVSLLLAVATLVLLLVRPSRDYFAARTRARRGY